MRIPRRLCLSSVGVNGAAAEGKRVSVLLDTLSLAMRRTMEGMKPTKPAFSALLLLLPLAACEPVGPAEQPTPMQPPAVVVPPVLAVDAAISDASTPDASALVTPPATDAAPSAEAGARDASSSDASAADASSLGDAQSSEAGAGCLSPCPVGGPCAEEAWLVAPPRCGKPPVPPTPPSPPAICTSVTTAIPGYCGSYSCKLTTGSFAAAFNPSGHCANARDFMCAGTIHAIAFQCMINNALLANAPEQTALCIKADPSVVASHMGDACVGCFVTAHECCKNNEACLSICLQGMGKACDDAQRAAGCVAPLITCTGLPNPF
jgi:hypothetical protein